MRPTLTKQLSIVTPFIQHPYAVELQKMAEIISQCHDVLPLIALDLTLQKTTGKQGNPATGRPGMTAEQILKTMLIMKVNSFTYEALAFHLADSVTYRTFCGFGFADESPQRATLHENIKKVNAATWGKVNEAVLLVAAKRSIEKGEVVRSDCTVTDSNIHYPNDAHLLWDGVRVLTRLNQRAYEWSNMRFFHRASKAAKHRWTAILYSKEEKERSRLYRDLISITEKVIHDSESVLKKLNQTPKEASSASQKRKESVIQRLRHFIGLIKRGISQARRRVLEGEKVPSTEKIVSIFEEHTDIIVKDRRDTLFGHKISLTTGKSGLVLGTHVEDGNPGDKTLAVKLMEQQRVLYKKAPKQAVFDGGFASKANMTALKDMGIKDVVFSKPVGIPINEMAKSRWVYRKLRRFRAGIEGTISYVKRCFGLSRCNWKGYASFKAYVQASVLTCNISLLAQHLLLGGTPMLP